jgi:hypothetical protein
MEKLRPQRSFECLDLLASAGVEKDFNPPRRRQVKLRSSATAMKYLIWTEIHS